jgi:hypothetical protein
VMRLNWLPQTNALAAGAPSFTMEMPRDAMTLDRRSVNRGLVQRGAGGSTFPGYSRHSCKWRA